MSVLQLPSPAFELLAQLGSVTSDGVSHTGAAVGTDNRDVRVTEVRVLPEGYRQLVLHVGLERTALLLLIAQSSVIRGGQLVCTATNEELGELAGVSRYSISRLMGKIRNPEPESLLGAGAVEVEHNVTATGMRSAGRRVVLHPQLVTFAGTARPVSPTGSVRPPATSCGSHSAGGSGTGETAHTGPGPGGTCVGDPRLGGTCTCGQHTAEPANTPSGRILTDARRPSATANTLDALDDDVHQNQAKRESTRTSAPPEPPDHQLRQRLLARLLQLGFQGADDLLDRHPLELIERTLAYVEQQAGQIERPAAYLNRLVSSGGPPAEQQGKRRPAIAEVFGSPLHAPGRPQGPVSEGPQPAAPPPGGAASAAGDDHPGFKREGGPVVVANQDITATGDPRLAGGKTPGGGAAGLQGSPRVPAPTPPGTPDEGTADDAALPNEPYWPLPELDEETVSAIEAQVDSELAPHLPRRGRLFGARCRLLARDWGFV